MLWQKICLIKRLYSCDCSERWRKTDREILKNKSAYEETNRQTCSLFNPAYMNKYINFFRVNKSGGMSWGFSRRIHQSRRVHRLLLISPFFCVMFDVDFFLYSLQTLFSFFAANSFPVAIHFRFILFDSGSSCSGKLSPFIVSVGIDWEPGKTSWRKMRQPWELD